MRLDKFLKVSRLIKRRTVANKVCDSARVFINGNPAKPAKMVKVGDILRIEYSNFAKSYKIVKIPEKNILAQEAPELYEIMPDTF